MAISIAGSNPGANVSPNSAAGSGNIDAADGNKKQEAVSDAAELTPAAKARQQLNASILQSSLSVSIGAQNEPLALVFKSALTGINEALQADFGENAIESAVGQDNTPQGTASRIVSLSTAFYEAFKQQNPGQDEEVLLNKFMDTIRAGADTGFEEARGILDGLEVLGGGTAANIDQTYALVQQGYDDFAAAQRKGFATAATKSDSGR